MTEFDKVYKGLVAQIFNEGIEEKNERTGLKTLIVTGVHFSFDLAQEFPLLTLRKIPLKLFVAEQIWYIQGDKELDFFQKYSKIWDDFKDDSSNTVETAYGYRWNKYFDRNQLDGLIKMLKSDPSSRHGVVITWDPSSDGLASPKKKNVPCVPMWVANIVDGKLNFHVVFRSNDVMLGLPHDVAGFALLQNIIAQEIGVELGKLHYTISHAHIYENHYRHAAKLLTRMHEHVPISLKLPKKTFSRARKQDEKIVAEILKNLKSQYNPLPSLGRMQIAL